ncbi:FKBP-type peptidyl-prolyl cis-trans isomerase [Chitinophagales bacterium]|nr:FKBP-type peptidyl-prolyl cis-trans isomerase [Chitinophagales bacterium]
MKNILIAFVLVLLMSCGKTKDYTEENEQEILTYLADNNLTAQKSSTSLYYIIDNVGTGERPSASDNVTVAYKGYFTNGNTFDESSASGISFNLQQVIAGWTEGITYFKEGGNGVLLIPSRLAYGDSGQGNIPGGAVLIFDVTLISVN